MSSAVRVAPPPLSFRFEPDLLEPAEGLRACIDQLWLEEQRSRPSVHDGTLLSVRRIDGGVVTAGPCPYRYFVARERNEDIRRQVEVRALAVSGVVLLGSPGAHRIIVGRRSADVTEYPGAWELVPSGGVGPEWVEADGTIDVLGALLDELEQEAGIPRKAVADTQCLGLVHDVAQDGYDACFAVYVPEARPVPRPEYSETAVVSVEEARVLLHDHGAVPTSQVVLDLAVEAGLA